MYKGRSSKKTMGQFLSDDAPQVLINTMRVATTTTPRTTATKWIIVPDATTFKGPLNHGEEADALQYIPLLTSANGTPIDTIAEIDVDPYMLTRYAVSDYVLQ